VLFATAALALLLWQWRPLPEPIWAVQQPIAVMAITAVFWLGWAILLLSTFLINHFELFGLQQAWFHWRGRQAEPPKFRTPLFYKWIRHPLYLGFFLAFWATPEMTAGHLLLAAGVSVYMLIAIRYEERDLIDLFGKDYEDYREQAGMLTPRIRRRNRSPAA
jgi:protein-S-isoprenylcysteine O-methyltransferase Ste14